MPPHGNNPDNQRPRRLSVARLVALSATVFYEASDSRGYRVKVVATGDIAMSRPLKALIFFSISLFSGSILVGRSEAHHVSFEVVAQQGAPAAVGQSLLLPDINRSPDLPANTQNTSAQIDKIMDGLLGKLTSDWVVLHYDAGSASGSELESESADKRQMTIRTHFTLNKGTQGWARVSFYDGKVDCVFWWSLPDQCDKPMALFQPMVWGSKVNQAVGTIYENTTINGDTDDEADLGPFIPWPPLTPSARGDVTSKVGLANTLGEIDAHIAKVLDRSGYNNKFYFSLPNGFAVITPLERTSSVGGVLPDQRRWSLEKETSNLSITNYAKHLIFGSDDRFRMFLFIVTNDYFGTQEDVPHDRDVERWLKTGRDVLSPRIGQRLTPKGTKIQLFVYEFALDKGRASDSADKISGLVAQTDGALPFSVQLKGLKF